MSDEPVATRDPGSVSVWIALAWFGVCIVASECGIDQAASPYPLLVCVAIDLVLTAVLLVRAIRVFSLGFRVSALLTMIILAVTMYIAARACSFYWDHMRMHLPHHRATIISGRWL